MGARGRLRARPCRKEAGRRRGPGDLRRGARPGQGNPRVGGVRAASGLSRVRPTRRGPPGWWASLVSHVGVCLRLSPNTQACAQEALAWLAGVSNPAGHSGASVGPGVLPQDVSIGNPEKGLWTPNLTHCSAQTHFLPLRLRAEEGST